MSGIYQSLRMFAADDRGTTAIEYGLIVSLIVLIVLAGMQAVGSATIAMYNVITSAMMGS
jgi:Flp pilus assembly pilin Flp